MYYGASLTKIVSWIAFSLYYSTYLEYGRELPVFQLIKMILPIDFARRFLVMSSLSLARMQIGCYRYSALVVKAAGDVMKCTSRRAKDPKCTLLEGCNHMLLEIVPACQGISETDAAMNIMSEESDTSQ